MANSAAFDFIAEPDVEFTNGSRRRKAQRDRKRQRGRVGSDRIVHGKCVCALSFNRGLTPIKREMQDEVGGVIVQDLV